MKKLKNKVMGIITLILILGLVSPALSNELLKDALYNHHVMKDFKKAQSLYENYLKKISTEKNTEDKKISSGIENYYRLLEEIDKTDIFFPFMKKLKFSEKFFNHLKKDIILPADSKMKYLVYLVIRKKSGRKFWDTNFIIEENTPDHVYFHSPEKNYDLKITLKKDGDYYIIENDLKLSSLVDNKNIVSEFKQKLKIAKQCKMILKDNKNNVHYTMSIYIEDYNMKDENGLYKVRRANPENLQYEYSIRLSQKENNTFITLWNPNYKVMNQNESELYFDTDDESYFLKTEATYEKSCPSHKLKLTIKNSDNMKEDYIFALRGGNDGNSEFMSKNKEKIYYLEILTNTIERERSKITKKKRISSEISVNKNNVISLNFNDVQISKIIKLLQSKTEKIIIYPEHIGEKKISIQLKNAKIDSVLQIISKFSGSTIIETKENIIIEDLNSETLKKARTYNFKNLKLAEIKKLFLKNLDKKEYSLTKMMVNKDNSITVNLLITPQAQKVFDKLVAKYQTETYKIKFKLYEFSGDSEKLISSPVIIVNEGKEANIEVNNKKDSKNKMFLKITSKVRRHNAELLKVSLDLYFEKETDGKAIRTQTRSEFNISKDYDYLIYDNKGEKRFRLNLTIEVQE